MPRNHGGGLKKRIVLANQKYLTNYQKRQAISLLGHKYSIARLCKYFNISKSSFYYKEVDASKKYLEFDKKVLEIFAHDPYAKNKFGYRKVINKLVELGIKKPSERRVKTLMRQNGLFVNQKKVIKKYNSYKKDGNSPVINWLYSKRVQNNKIIKEHYFRPQGIWEMLTTDVTEFHVNDFVVYFSPIIDMFDSMPLAYKISSHPDHELIHSSLDELIKKKPENANFVLHSDQGCVYRSDEWKNKCKENGILQSMSRKGKSGDNAPAEGFFGRLKQEWFYNTNFKGYTKEQFIRSLKYYLWWYKNNRPQEKLGGISPAKFRSNIE